MECPIDGTPLETRTVHSVNIEECVQCRGLWFEKGELRKAKDESEPDLNWLDFDLWANPESFTADWSPRKCPQCGKNMATISYAETGVAVDYCAEGHGVWLDKGEFQAIVKALNAEVVSKSASDYVTASLQEALEILTGDEGIISEWRDFVTVMRLLQYRVLAENPRLAALLSAIQSTSPF
jgi:Zn-finger nucleic acid-binding protein